MNAAARWKALAALFAAAALLAACTSPPPPAPAPAPPADPCRVLDESLVSAVPPGQSLAELQARGIRLRTPLVLPPGAGPRPGVNGGAAVQMLIQPDGSVAPGSPKTVKSLGEPQVASAAEAGALSMNFDIDGPAKPTAPVPFTTTFVVCVRP
jgi:hypothetical protein